MNSPPVAIFGRVWCPAPARFRVRARLRIERDETPTNDPDAQRWHPPGPPGKRQDIVLRPEARAWRARWKAVREAEIAELRATPMDVKLRQLDALTASAHLFPKTATEEKEERAVRNRWNRLRRILQSLGLPGPILTVRPVFSSVKSI